MKFPSKVTPYKESIIAKFPLILTHLEKVDMDPALLYKKVKNKVDDIREYMEILDCLYALNKIELKEEVLHYVD
ncbi:ABC-three component system middle component 7 [uncultured Tyzzerella sp.]|uniref:ABC-three component system middle component 7 n=1 Tax=uncultured Tyzzerella sp. TaxID=2321398 RepID=UPI0034DDA096